MPSLHYSVRRHHRGILVPLIQPDNSKLINRIESNRIESSHGNVPKYQEHGTDARVHGRVGVVHCGHVLCESVAAVRELSHAGTRQVLQTDPWFVRCPRTRDARYRTWHRMLRSRARVWG